MSVVIPLYNKVNHIQRALDSVMTQTHQDFEVIVVNDGSTDGSAEVVERYADPRIRLVHQGNSGVSAARNRGIAESRAELIAFLDADDEWLAEHLEIIWRMYRRFPGCGAYATVRSIVDHEGKSRVPSYGGIPAPPWEGIVPNYFRTVLLGRDPINSSGVAVPRCVFDVVEPFRDGVRRGEDTDMWCRIALRFPIALSTQVGEICHREAENRASHRPRPHNLQVIDSLGRALKSRTLPKGVQLRDILEYKNQLHIACAVRCIADGSPVEARAHLRAAASTVRFRRARFYWYVRSFVPRALERRARAIKRLLIGARSIRP